MQKLLAGVPIDAEEGDENDLTAVEIEDAVIRIQTKVEKDIKLKEEKIKVQLDGLLNGLQQSADNPSIFDSKLEFKFSPELKHTGITVVNDNVIKSV